MHSLMNCHFSKSYLRFALAVALIFLLRDIPAAEKVASDTDELAWEMQMQMADAVRDQKAWADAEQLYGLAIQSYPAGTKAYSSRGQMRYQQKKYIGAIEDFDEYLKRMPSDTKILMLRSIAKTLLTPPDVAGACADLMLIKQMHISLENLGIGGTGKYCQGQKGWSDGGV
jgi:tetratricopeptide (TPR) repeat protein